MGENVKNRLGTEGMKRAVFLDRDGVLNRAVVRDGKPYPPATAAELELVDGAAEALQRLKARGFLLLVATNQPDVARGKQSRAEVEAIHSHLTARLPLDGFTTCFHDDADGCACRKPRPGLMLDAARAYGIDLSASYMIGDRWRDIEAGQRAGCRTAWIDYGYQERGPACPPNIRVESIGQAADWILKDSEEPLMQETRPLAVKLFADGAEKKSMLEWYANPLIRGFTTNPTLMRKAGIGDYEAFARDVLEAIPDRPISFEVFADEFHEMERQARRIAHWGPNVYVKIPVTNTRRESSAPLVQRLSHDGIQLNVTALLTLAQAREMAEALAGGAPANISIFAGRIADTGRDPVPMMAAAVELLRPHPQIELIWASPREVLNLYQADQVGCHIITATPDILRKLPLRGHDLASYSQETVQMFYDDASRSGFRLG